LKRELYTETEAARLLRVPRINLRYWLAGGRRAGRTHGPVIHRGGARSPFVTWGQFLDAAVLACFLPASGADAGAFADMLARLRADLGTRHPLADRRTYRDHLEVLHRAHRAAGLAPALWLVTADHGGLALSPGAESFRRRTDWQGDTAVGWCPHDEPGSPVRVRPDLRFGRPTVGGIGTATLREHHRAGEDETAIAEMFELSAEDVRWALSFETSRPENQA
jgi:uncharacterized protein (DUF433 family)